MVLRDRNHPSIIIWSIGNEVDYPNDPYCHPLFESMTGNNDANKPAAERQYDVNRPNAERLAVIAKRLVKFVKECDTTRPVTAALAFPELSNLTGYAETLDIVGYNYKEHLYPEDYKKYPGRVTYGSENSGTLEAWLAVKDNDHICGQFIWTGIDYMGEAKGWPIRVAESGFLDTAGFKKTSYYYRQSLWQIEPMIYLGVKRQAELGNSQNRNWNEAAPVWNWLEKEKLQICCFTNCEEVELFINEKSLGTKHLSDFLEYVITWEAEYEEGTLKAVGRNSNGRTCTINLNTALKPEKLVIKVDGTELIANGQDIAHIEIQAEDHKDNLVYSADNNIKLSIKGPGEIIGIENGAADDLVSYNSTSRRLHHGRLLVYVRSLASSGKIIITAEGNDLRTAKTIIDNNRM